MTMEIILMTIVGTLKDLFLQGSIVVYALALGYGVANYKK